MFSKSIQIILTSTSISPLLLLLYLKAFSQHSNINNKILYLILAITLFILLLIIIKLAKTKLEKIPIKITQITNTNKEKLLVSIPYVTLLLNNNILLTSSILLLFIIITFITNTYHFNPLLTLLGYHQYKITLNNNTTFILLTKKTLNNITHQLLHIRHQFKVGFFSELKQDIPSAVKSYKNAYSYLTENARIHDTNILEMKIIAGFLTYKVKEKQFS